MYNRSISVCYFVSWTSSFADLGSGAFFDPWIRDPGWVKIKIRIRDEHPGSYSESLGQFFGLKYCNSFVQIWNPGIFFTMDPGWIRFGSGIRDKHPGCLTLRGTSLTRIRIRSDLKHWLKWVAVVSGSQTFHMNQLVIKTDCVSLCSGEGGIPHHHRGREGESHPR